MGWKQTPSDKYECKIIECERTMWQMCMNRSRTRGIGERLCVENERQQERIICWQQQSMTTRDSALRYSFTLQIISHMYSSTSIFVPVVCERACVSISSSFVRFFRFFSHGFLFNSSYPFVSYLFFNAMHFVSLRFVCIEIQTYGQCILLCHGNLYFKHWAIFSLCCLLFLWKNGIEEREREKEFSEVRSSMSKKLEWAMIWMPW